jgi:hypothetical protein
VYTQLTILEKPNSQFFFQPTNHSAVVVKLWYDAELQTYADAHFTKLTATQCVLLMPGIKGV